MDREIIKSEDDVKILEAFDDEDADYWLDVEGERSPIRHDTLEDIISCLKNIRLRSQVDNLLEENGMSRSDEIDDLAEQVYDLKD